jgi:hypothetical protein
MNLRRIARWYLLLALLGGIACTCARIVGTPSLVPLVVNAICNAVPLIAAAYFGFRVAGDYPSSSKLRLAWQLMALSAVLGVVRYAFEYSTIIFDFWSSYATTWVGVRQVPVNAALATLLLAAWLMWLSFAKIGFGLAFRWSDYASFGLILAIVSAILAQRSGLTDSHSEFAWVRFLQALSPVLIGVNAVLAVILYRVSSELGVSGLARSLRYLVIYLVSRLAALLLQLPPGWQDNLVVDFFRTTLWLAVNILFAIAVIERWSISCGVSALVKEYGPASESTPEVLIEAAARVAGTPARGHRPK